MMEGHTVNVTGITAKIPGCVSLGDFLDKISTGHDFKETERTLLERKECSNDNDFQKYGSDAHEGSFLGCEVKADSTSLHALQLAYEAVCDAGYCREDLLDSHTGIYVKGNNYTANFIPKSSTRAEFISSVFKFHGPSIMLDENTSVLVVIDLAINAIRKGSITRAVVLDIGLNSHQCVAYPIGGLMIESSLVKPECAYLQLLGSGVCSGNELSALVDLFESVCIESNVDPRHIAYIEACNDILKPNYEASKGQPNELSKNELELAAIDQIYGYHLECKQTSSSEDITLISNFTEPYISENMKIRQEKMFIFSSKSTSISSGATWTLPLPVSTSLASIKYQFDSKDGDMIFAMYYITPNKKMVLVPQRLFDFEHDCTEGTFNLLGPGTLYMRWSNTHSWFGEKILRYSVEICEIEHEVVQNPQYDRIKEAQLELCSTNPLAQEQQRGVSQLETYISKVRYSDLSVLAGECNQMNSRLCMKKNVLKLLEGLRRRSSVSLNRIETRRRGLLLRSLNSYQLHEVLSYLNHGLSSVVCKYWAEVTAWDKKIATLPKSDYVETLAFQNPHVSIDDELKSIVEEYVRSESSMAENGGGMNITELKKRRCKAPIVTSFGDALSETWKMSLLPMIKVIDALEKKFVQKSHAITSTVPKPFLNSRLQVADSSGRIENNSICALNYFASGHNTAHVLCSQGDLRDSCHFGAAKITRYIFGQSRTALEEYVKCSCLSEVAWLKHLRQSSCVDTFPWRGLLVEDGKLTTVNLQNLSHARKKVVFSYAGNGTEWQDSALQLWNASELFRSTLLKGCKDLPLDIEKLFSMPDLSWLQLQFPDFGVTLLQVGFTVVLRSLGIVPDIVLGHGIGEIACSFADGCTSESEAFKIALCRSQLCQSLDFKGLMLDVSLDYCSAAEFIKAYPSCALSSHNCSKHVTFSGRNDDIVQIAESLKAIGVTTKLRNTGELCYNSDMQRDSKEAIEKLLKSAMLGMSSRKRSTKWLSTSCSSCLENSMHECYYPAVQYELNSICNMIDFASMISSLPSEAIVADIGSSSEWNNEEYGKSIICHPITSIDSAVKLADQLWMLGNSLKFPKKTSVVPINHQLSIRWSDSSHATTQNTFQFNIGVAGAAGDVLGVNSRARVVSIPQSVVENKQPESTKSTTAYHNQGGLRAALSRPNDLSSLYWQENDSIPNCEIRYCAVNDIDSSPEDRFGWEYSGVRDDGVAIMGLLPGGALATHLLAPHDKSECNGHLTWPVPNYLSLKEAATIPFDHCSAYHAIVIKAKIQPEDSIFIDDICCSAGQAAFHLLRQYGCNVVTCCSTDQTALTCKSMGITEDNIITLSSVKRFAEKDLERFAKKIDVALHVGIENLGKEVLDILKISGQFCVINRSCPHDILNWANMRSISVHYTNMKAVLQNPADCERIFSYLQSALFKGEVVAQALDPCRDIYVALDSISHGNVNAGRKVLVEMSDRCRLHCRGIDEKICRVFLTGGSHLIVGEIDNEAEILAKFLIEAGAQHVTICDSFDNQLKNFNLHEYANISSLSLNLTDPASCCNLLRSMKKSLRGIWCTTYLTAEVSDADLCPLFNIDAFSRDMPLEQFVVWRRRESGLSQPSSSEYDWVAEKLCYERKSIGLPGKVIQLQSDGNCGFDMGMQDCVTHLNEILTCDDFVYEVSRLN